MTADAMATCVAKASAAMLLTYLSYNIPAPAPPGLMFVIFGPPSPHPHLCP